tara:strand:- start:267 stop:461 length:195 start_codon:yes stop_codon:yes gene_type:complete
MIYGLLSGTAFVILISFIKNRRGYRKGSDNDMVKLELKKKMENKFSVGIFIFAALLLLYGVFVD